MLVTLADDTRIDVDLKQCAQCGRVSTRQFVTIPTEDLGGPQLYVCSGRQACQRRVAKARQAHAAATELRNPPRPAPAEDVPTGRVQDWAGSRGSWTAEEQEDHFRTLALAIGFDPASRDALHPRVRARTARPRQTAA